MKRGEVEGRLDATSLNPALIAWKQAISAGAVKARLLGDGLAGIRYGTGTPPPMLPEGPGTVPFVRATDIKDGRILIERLPHVASDQPPAMEKCLLKGNEIIVVRSGVNTGDCALVPDVLEGAFAAYDLIVDVDEAEFYPPFVVEFLYSSFGKAQIDGMKNRAAQPHVNAQEVRSIQVPDLPLPLQISFANEIEEARSKRFELLFRGKTVIEEIDRIVLAELGIQRNKPKQSKVFASKRFMVGTRLDPFFHSPSFIELEREISLSNHSALADLVEFSSLTWDAKNHPETSFNYIEISGVDRVTGRAVPSRIAVETAPSRARMTTRPGDVLVSLTRPHHGSIALLDDRHEGCIASTGFAVICDVDTDRTSARFVWTMLRLSICLDQMLRRSSGGNYPAITQEELGKVLIPLPDKATQQRICDEVERRHAEARRLEEEAQSIWQAARQRFEDQLLNGVAP